ncbi:helix-turn-helix transcriptional regulator [Sphingobacterium sp. DN00404]|uniref:Helix-turn-helix transcriptional regulator n=1 Tax=Sphingobacterium micropteri TaxID=2763501 RepID=A0ABR7YLZ9_9SPHI|nr:helix-turn-helix transcriptional regulator [Sphingobacterium micropteri]MBD1432350.1 helix-turn-helix transcriptional regulator [Sphingobacterium micropteri]
MDIKDRVGQRLKALRKEKNMTQEKLSFESDVDKTYISEVENGKRNISMVNLEKLILTIGYSLKEFFDDESFL